MECADSPARESYSESALCRPPAESGPPPSFVANLSRSGASGYRHCCSVDCPQSIGSDRPGCAGDSARYTTGLICGTQSPHRPPTGRQTEATQRSNPPFTELTPIRPVSVSARCPVRGVYTRRFGLCWFRTEGQRESNECLQPERPAVWSTRELHSIRPPSCRVFGL